MQRSKTYKRRLAIGVYNGTIRGHLGDIDNAIRKLGLFDFEPDAAKHVEVTSKNLATDPFTNKGVQRVDVFGYPFPGMQNSWYQVPRFW